MINPAEKFLEIKEDILNNLVNLQVTLERCTEAGMVDPNDNMYNRIDTLITEVKNTHEEEELKGMLTQAQTIEIQIDSWLVSKGETTITLPWPSF